MQRATEIALSTLRGVVRYLILAGIPQRVIIDTVQRAMTDPIDPEAPDAG